jgi:hypothetical protein
MIFPILNILAPLMLLSPFVDAEFLDTSIASRNLGPQHPKLSAVTTKSRLRRRGDAFTPKTDCAHEYAEGNLRLIKLIKLRRLMNVNRESIVARVEFSIC